MVYSNTIYDIPFGDKVCVCRSCNIKESVGFEYGKTCYYYHTKTTYYGGNNSQPMGIVINSLGLEQRLMDYAQWMSKFSYTFFLGGHYQEILRFRWQKKYQLKMVSNNNIMGEDRECGTLRITRQPRYPAPYAQRNRLSYFMQYILSCFALTTGKGVFMENTTNYIMYYWYNKKYVPNKIPEWTIVDKKIEFAEGMTASKYFMDAEFTICTCHGCDLKDALGIILKMSSYEFCVIVITNYYNDPYGGYLNIDEKHLFYSRSLYEHIWKHNKHLRTNYFGFDANLNFLNTHSSTIFPEIVFLDDCKYQGEVALANAVYDVSTYELICDASLIRNYGFLFSTTNFGVDLYIWSKTKNQYEFLLTKGNITNLPPSTTTDAISTKTTIGSSTESTTLTTFTTNDSTTVNNTTTSIKPETTTNATNATNAVFGWNSLSNLCLFCLFYIYSINITSKMSL